jgi:DNA-binding transcriptional ArsR family regulator
MARTKRSGTGSSTVTEMVISDVEQLKAISDPFRLQLVEAMAEPPARTWTAKELAERLGTKQTKLYHHLNLLEERGFLRVAETRMVSGILEKRYEVVALSFRVERSLLASGADENAFGGVLDAIFEKARIEILAGQRAGLIDLATEEVERRRVALWSSHARLSPASIRKVMRLIEKLADIDDLEEAGGIDYGLVVAFYPRASERTTTE